ncbi:MAG: restriction endonuclease [Betaproteobacteria bacterium]|nr:restriction endonuclease [Betaproteobacteria bacterium]
MAKRSLFVILSEQPWWVSLLVAMALFGAIQLFFPPLAPFVALPFVAAAVYFAWKQFRGTSPVNVEERLAALRDMPWENFGLIVSEAYRRRGYEVEESRGGAFDFTVRKNGQTTLVQCRRWKVNQVGVKPVQDLFDAMNKRDAFNCVCIAAGGFSESARAFAAGKPITLLTGAPLVELVSTIDKTSRRWFTR